MENIIENLAKEYGLKIVILFGSVAKNRANHDSDIDLAILSYSKLILKKELKLRYELRNLFKREVDLVFLQDAGPLLLGQIAKEGKLLFGKKKDFNTIRINAMKSYLDFAPYFRLQEKINRYKLKHA
jgi:predicted nucleotidyltransferase